MDFKFTLRHMLVGLVGVSLLMILGVNAYRHGPTSDIPFDAKKWHDKWDPDCEQNRYRMLADLKRHHLPVGMPERDVIALLGDPGGLPTDETREWRLRYDYGGYGGIRIRIRFDDQRRIGFVTQYGR